jgi:hypothetical protein
MGKGYSKRDLVRFDIETIDLDSNEFYGNSPPSVFVGRMGYPKVNVGVLSPAKIEPESWLYDAPEEWAARNYSARDIVRLRSNLINSRFKARIKGTNEKILSIAQEIGMSCRPVELEISLKEKPSRTISLDRISSPLINSANVKKIKVVGNPKVERKVERVIYDTDMKAVDALSYLYEKGISENFLSKALSIGLFGIKKNRKLVPTRWSITAVDDTIAKTYLDEVRMFEEGECCAFYGGYNGNYYLIMFFDDVWGFELFEIEVPLKINPWSKSGRFYATDYEDFYGRKNYAEETSGGYYAARLPIVKKLRGMQKQNAVMVIRLITEEDDVPVGVFAVREGVKKALRNRPLYFSDRELLINYAKVFIKKRFGISIENILKDSRLLKRIKTQKRLSKWL